MRIARKATDSPLTWVRLYIYWPSFLAALRCLCRANAAAFLASRSVLILVLISSLESGLDAIMRPNILSNFSASTLISSGMGVFYARVTP